MRFAITGIGVVSPIGVGEEAFFAALDQGTTGIRAEEPPAHPARPLSARVGDFGARERISAAALRRMPRLSRMATVAAQQALAGARGEWDATRVGVILGTGLGTLEETVNFVTGYLERGPEGASPAVFPVSVMNAATAQLALELKLRGVNSTVNHRDHSSLSALGMACDYLALGRADALVVGGVDELSPPVHHAYVALGGVAPGPMRPYDAGRDGLTPGEAAVLFVLEREEDARRRGAPIRGIVAGRGETGEARPRVGWGHAAAWPEAARAVALAAGDEADRISWVAGAGNGTTLDERELDAIREGLGRLPPTSSILGQTGECLSSAMLRLLAALYALERNRLPGTVGLTRPPDRFAGALLTAPRAAPVDRVLVPSFAQGGANLAFVVERG
jgi:3-oxoacyl-[acyl-carrier-protein] synthase II